MKRYQALIKTILAYVECQGSGESLAPPEVSGYTPSQVAYHVELCKQAGYMGGGKADIRLLTWEGHNALDALRETPNG